jgi:two-component system sensor histidine kinase KdpD
VALERAGLASAAAENLALRQADRLRQAMLNSISHDFRTPLSTVLGASTTLLDYEAELSRPVRRDLLQSIAEAARRLNRFVGELLDMSRLEGGALKPRRLAVDVGEVLDSLTGRLAEPDAAVRIVRDLPPGLAAAGLDPTLLEQAMLNIVENALAYAPPGSPVKIAARRQDGRLLIAVEDEGPGIPAEALEAVFERFRRLGRDGGRGLGLGLSIARGFVEAMGGRVTAESPLADGRGTRIVISLPSAPA